METLCPASGDEAFEAAVASEIAGVAGTTLPWLDAARSIDLANTGVIGRLGPPDTGEVTCASFLFQDVALSPPYGAKGVRAYGAHVGAAAIGPPDLGVRPGVPVASRRVQVCFRVVEGFGDSACRIARRHRERAAQNEPLCRAVHRLERTIAELAGPEIMAAAGACTGARCQAPPR